MRDLPKSINDLNLINAVYARRQSSMDAKDLIVDHYRQREEVEHVGEVVPHICVAVFPCALGVEAVGLGHAAGLVVAAD